jgi:hypothetical protein
MGWTKMAGKGYLTELMEIKAISRGDDLFVTNVERLSS